MPTEKLIEQMADLWGFVSKVTGRDCFVDEQTLAQAGKAWTKVNHSVVLLGWGEDEGGNKYWIARNSYGPGWGQMGDFMIRRG